MKHTRLLEKFSDKGWGEGGEGDGVGEGVIEITGVWKRDVLKGQVRSSVHALYQNAVFLPAHAIAAMTSIFEKVSQGLQILLMSRVTVTSASQILESFWNIWSQVSQRKKPFSDFPARGPGMYTLSWGIHEVAVMVHWPKKLKSMMDVIK